MARMKPHIKARWVALGILLYGVGVLAAAGAMGWAAIHFAMKYW